MLCSDGPRARTPQTARSSCSTLRRLVPPNWKSLSPQQLWSVPLLWLAVLVVSGANAGAASGGLFRETPGVGGRRRLADAQQHTVTVVGPATGSRPATYLRCSGLSPSKRACVAHNLYYHCPRQVFVAFGPDTAAGSEGNMTNYISSPDEDYTLAHYNVTLAPHSAAPDAQTPMLKQAGLNVFWKFTNGGAGYSIGHALVHELLPLFQTLRVLLHGHVPLAFNLVTMEGRPGDVFEHIVPAIQGRHVSWPDLCAKAKDAGAEWIWLEAATLGDRGRAALAQNIHYQHHPDPSGMFNSLTWLRLRSWMLRSVGLHPTTEPAMPPLVLLNDKVMADGSLEKRRRIANVEEVAKWLQDELPGVQVQRAQFMKMTWKEQLELLSRASVFITTEGSSGFRMPFLPPGATTIMLGHPDNMTEGAQPLSAFHVFHDVDKYFALVYVRFSKYHVNIDHKDEYTIGQYDATDRQGLRNALHNAHIFARKERIVPLVREALAQAALHRSTFAAVQNWQDESL